MGTLKVTYDDVGDILYLDTVAPYEGQVTRPVGEGVIVRCHPKSGAVENVEVWAFRSRAGGEHGLDLPIFARLATARLPIGTS